MADDKKVSWVNVGALWKPDEKKPYKLGGTLEAGQLLLAAHEAISRGETRVRVYLYENEEKKDKAPDYRLSVPIERGGSRDSGGGGDDGGSDDGGDNPPF